MIGDLPAFGWCRSGTVSNMHTVCTLGMKLRYGPFSRFATGSLMGVVSRQSYTIAFLTALIHLDPTR